MNITRRFFIGGASAFGAFAGLRAFAAASNLMERKRGNLRFGIVSDVHVSASLKDGKTIGKEAPKLIEQAFTYFNEQGVDAVVICGDLASFGTVDELQVIANIWNKVFPNGKRSDGEKVEKVFIMGNHDWEGWQYSQFANKFLADLEVRKDRVLALDCEKNWRKVFDEDFRQFGVKTVKGYDFIQSHFIGSATGRTKLCFADCHHGIREFYASYKAKGERPFFHIQHPMPKNTCYGAWGWGQDNGDAVAALSAFPQAIALSGHSHYPIADERAIWQGAFTSIGCGTLVSPSRSPGRAGFGYDPATAHDIENVHGNKASVMDIVEKNGIGRCAMLVDVYDDNVRFTRLQMPEKLVIGDDWVVPTAASSERPFAFAARAKKSIVPEFSDGAKVTSSSITKKKRECVSLSFPPANAIKGARVYEYEITAIAEDGKKSVYRVLQSGYNGSEKSSATNKTQHFELAIDRLSPSKKYVFEVRPCECFGKKGVAIKTEFSIV